jgi:hypothetical protein
MVGAQSPGLSSDIKISQMIHISSRHKQTLPQKAELRKKTDGIHP